MEQKKERQQQIEEEPKEVYLRRKAFLRDLFSSPPNGSMQKGVYKLLTEAQAARMIGVVPEQFKLWRKYGFGPPYVIFGARQKDSFMYAIDDILEWLQSLRPKSRAPAAPETFPQRIRSQALQSEANTVETQTSELPPNTRRQVPQSAGVSDLPQTGPRDRAHPEPRERSLPSPDSLTVAQYPRREAFDPESTENE